MAADQSGGLGGKSPTVSVEDIILKVQYHEPANLLSDYLTELGAGGLFIRTSASLEVGRELTFSISFPGLLEPVLLHGIVRFLRAVGEVPGQGAGVGVEVRGDASRAALEAVLARLRAPRSAAEQRDLRVLLVEDNDFVKDLFRYAVKRYHRDTEGRSKLEIRIADDGMQALEALREGPVDLAIIDHFLPVLTGVQVIERMRADPALAGVPILMVTVGDEEVREKALCAGADLCLEKPVLLKQLLNTLEQLVGWSK